MADISPLIQAANVRRLQSAEGQKALVADNEAYQQSTSDTAKLNQRQGDLAAILSSSADAFTAQIEQAKTKASVQLGTDIEDVSGRQAALAKQHLAAIDAREALAQQIDAKQSVNFFDNPLAFVSGFVTVDEDIRAHNAQNATAVRSARNIETLNHLTDVRVSTLNNLKLSTSVATSQATAEKAKNQYLLLSAEADRQGILHNSATVQKLVDAKAGDMQAQALLYNAANDAERMAQTRASFALQVEEHNRRFMKDKETDSVDAYIKERIGLGLKLAHPNDPAAWTVPQNAIAIMKSGLDPNMTSLFKAGARSFAIDPSGKSSHLGTSPSDLAEFLSLSPQLAQGATVGPAIIEKVKKSISADPEYAAAKANKDQKGMEAAFNRVANREVAKQADSPQSPTSVYYLPSITQIASDPKLLPQLQEFAFYKKVLAPQVAAKVDFTDPGKVYAAGLEAVKKGEISAGQFAADYSTMYFAAQRLNLAKSQLVNQGFNATVSYKIELPGNFGFGTDTVDAVNAKSVMEKVMKDMAVYRSQGGGADSGVGTFGAN